MKEQLLLLRALQEIDTRINEIRQAMAALPAKVAPDKAHLTKLEAVLATERTKLSETESWRGEQESLIRREEEAVRAARSKLQQSKNTREHSAATREVDNKRRSISEREDEVLKVFEAMEKTRTTLENYEKDVAMLRERIAVEEAEIQVKLGELEAEAAKHQAERQEVAVKVPKDLLRKYDTIIARRGLAVVAAKGGVCQGCHMSLPPQLYNQLARFEALEHCPRCQRLIYRHELLEPEGEEASQV